MVEAALALLPFVAVLLGAVDIARIMFVHSAVNERVRHVTRAATINHYTPSEITNRIVYNSPSAPATDGESGIVPRGFQGLLPSNVYVEYLNEGTNERRLKVDIKGMQVVTVSPWLATVGGNIPISLTVPLETP